MEPCGIPWYLAVHLVIVYFLALRYLPVLPGTSWYLVVSRSTLWENFPAGSLAGVLEQTQPLWAMLLGSGVGLGLRIPSSDKREKNACLLSRIGEGFAWVGESWPR